MKPTLSLKREHLAELSYDDLTSVVGADGGLTPVIQSIPLDNCLVTSAKCCTASGSCR